MSGQVFWPVNATTTMKNFNALLLISFLTFLMLGCKKEETLDQSDTSISLKGRWKMIASYQDDGKKPYWIEDSGGNENGPYMMEFRADGTYSGTIYGDFNAYKITAPGKLLMQAKDDGEWYPFKYFGTNKDELVIYPFGGKYACYDGYSCLKKFKRFDVQ